MSNGKNTSILRKIIQYCDEIAEANERFGNSLEALDKDSVYKNATAMCIVQIGELAGHLTDEFRSQYSDMPWRPIRAMRNIAVHNYGVFDIDTLWGTIQNDIPALRDFCTNVIQQHEAMEPVAKAEPDEQQGMKME